MILPTEKTPKKQGFQDWIMTIYGPPKIGKSSFCANFEDTLFLATEAGLKNLDVFQIPIVTWEDFLDACALLRDKKHGYKTVVIDTIDNLYAACAKYIVGQYGVKDVSEIKGYGMGWRLLNSEFRRAMIKLSLCPFGLVLVSHAQTITVPTRTGDHEKTVLSLPTSPRLFVLGMSDIVMYFGADVEKSSDGKIPEDRRYIRTQPTKHLEAGDRTGKLPAELPLDFEIFQAAFAAKTEERTNV